MLRGTVLRVLLLWAVLAFSGCEGGAPPEAVKLDEKGAAVLPEERGTKRITPQQVEFLRQKDIPVVLVDSRPRAMHAAERPAGSVSIPLDRTELVAPKLPRDQLIVTLCT